MYSRAMKICNMLLYDTEPPWDWVQTVQCSATTQRQFLDHIQLWSPSLWGNGISYAYQTLSVWKQTTKLHLLYMSYNTRYIYTLSMQSCFPGNFDYYFKFQQHPYDRQRQPQKFHIDDASLPIVLLISHTLREIFFNQSEALPRSG